MLAGIRSRFRWRAENQPVADSQRRRIQAGNPVFNSQFDYAVRYSFFVILFFRLFSSISGQLHKD